MSGGFVIAKRDRCEGALCRCGDFFYFCKSGGRRALRPLKNRCMKDSKKEYRTDVGRGCTFENGASPEESSARACPGCYKLGAYDWLSDIPEAQTGDIFEVRFKNTRKGYYRNATDLRLEVGDIVAVEASPGHDIGIVSMAGDMVAKQMRRTGFRPDGVEFKKIYRKAKAADIVKWQEAIALEHTTMIRSRVIAADLGLNMKIGDVEYQGDKMKAIFYYIADERVDFRELIKIFAEQFRIRIEMKQIGARQEAGRIGGIGSCGRELCCSTWMSGFVSVTTNSARFQEISLNPQKLAGQCGKLKCCLNYEVDTYLDARREFPKINAPLETMEGSYYLVKADIFKKQLSFSSDPGSTVNIVTVPLRRVKEILSMNRRGSKPDTLLSAQDAAPREQLPDFKNVVGEESITRFDTGKSGRRDNRRRRDRRDDSDKQPREGRQSRGGSQSRGEQRADQSRGEGQRGEQSRAEGPRREPRGEGQPRQAREGQPREGRDDGQRHNRRNGGRNRRRRGGAGDGGNGAAN